MYPLWLNIVSLIVLISVPIGFITVIFVHEPIGLVIIILAFLGVWIFGTVAKRIKDKG